MPEDMCKHGFELLAVVLHVRRVPKTFAGDEGSGILANELVMSAGRHRAVKLLAGSNRSCLGGRSQDLISMVTATLQQVMGREKITFCSSAELLKKIHTKRRGREVLRVCAGSAWASVSTEPVHTARGLEEVAIAERAWAGFWCVLPGDTVFFLGTCSIQHRGQRGALRSSASGSPSHH